MSRLKNGTVLPHGLVAADSDSVFGGFNKTFKNFSLKAGIVVKTHGKDSDLNISKAVPEYDVVVIEQNEDRSIVPILYRNCISAESFGGMADFFEVRLREQKEVFEKDSRGQDFFGQDGSIVLILCIDGNSESPIIIKSLKHPNRKSRLLEGKVLDGEINGVSVSISEDGSLNITFKGQTDNQGKPVDTSQGNTEIDIEKDGSFQLKHDGASFRVEKEGNISIKNKGETSINSEKDISLVTKAKFLLEASEDASMSMNELMIKAQGSALAEGQTFTLSGKSSVEIKGPSLSVKSSTVEISASSVTINGSVSVGGSGGLPVVLPTTKVLVIGNLGIPTLGTMIGPFSQKSLVN